MSEIRKDILVVLLTAFVVRVGAIGLAAHPASPQLWEFGPIAQSINSGTGYSLAYPDPTAGGGTRLVPSAYMPPAYVTFLAGLEWLFGTDIGGRYGILIIQALIGAGAAALLYVVSVKFFGRGTAWVSGLVGALYPPFIYAGLDYGSTILYLLLLGLFWTAALRFRQSKTLLNGLICGFVGGLAALTRAEGIILLAGFMVWFLWQLNLKSVLPLFAGAFVIVAPWLVRNSIVFESPAPRMTTSTGLNFWRGNNPEASGTGREWNGEGIWGTDQIEADVSRLPVDTHYEIARDSIYVHDAVRFVREHPLRESFLIVKKIFFFWVLDFTHPKARHPLYFIPWAIILLAFLVGLRSIEHTPASFFGVFYICMTIVVALFFVLPRYQIILAYGMIPISSVGFLSITRNIMKHKTGDLIGLRSSKNQ